MMPLYTPCHIFYIHVTVLHIFLHSVHLSDSINRFGTNHKMKSLSYLVSWSKLAALCIVIYGIIVSKGCPGLC